MRLLFWLPVWAGLLASSLAAGTVNFQVTNLGPNSYRYTYQLSGFNFAINQELDIQFDPSLYGTLTNGIAGSGWDLVLLQPDSPPGFAGDYSLLSLVNNPSLAGPFSVDFRFLGAGQPGAQSYTVNTFDLNHNYTGSIESGTSTNGVASTPEPANFWLFSAGLLMVLTGRRLRRNA